MLNIENCKLYAFYPGANIMEIIAFIISCFITSCLYLEQVMARNSFGAHQNVEGIDPDNGKPNVVMQSVVLGKNSNKHGYDDENEIEAAVRKLMKLFCPCASNKHHADDDDDADEYNDCHTDNYADLSIKRLTKLLGNKFKAVRRSSCEECRYNEDPHARSRNPFKGRRSKNEFIPYRSRSKAKNSRFIPRYEDNEIESHESVENIKRNLNLMRRRYDKRPADLGLASNEGEIDAERSRPDRNIFGTRRRPNVAGVGRQRFREDWLPQRGAAQYGRAPQGVPQDILYLPQLDRPVRRRNRFYTPERDFSAAE